MGARVKPAHRTGEGTMPRRKNYLPLIHPGEILLEEFLRPMRLSQTALAHAIDMSPRRQIGEKFKAIKPRAA